MSPILEKHLLRNRNTFTANKKNIYCDEKTHLLRNSQIKKHSLYFVFFGRIMIWRRWIQCAEIYKKNI